VTSYQIRRSGHGLCLLEADNPREALVRYFAEYQSRAWWREYVNPRFEPATDGGGSVDWNGSRYEAVPGLEAAAQSRKR